MSRISMQNFGFGAGLTALFDSTPGIMPSVIEDATELIHNGKKTRTTKGKFYSLTTPIGNEFIIYIKYSDKLVKNDNMVEGVMWEFGLSEVEKEKIELQYEKTGTFLMLLVCINSKQEDLDGEVALLSWRDYCEIRHRDNIQIGIWNNPEAKQQSAKMFYLRKGKGQKKEYFHTIKRNTLEKQSLDQYYISEMERTEIIPSDEAEGESNGDQHYFEAASEPIRNDVGDKGNAKNIIYIKDNAGWCGICRCKTKKIDYSSTYGQENGLDSMEKAVAFRCPHCNKIYITEDTYRKAFESKADIDFAVSFQRIRTLVDKVYEASDVECECCGRTLAISPCSLKIYSNLEENNKLDKKVNEELFYCKICGLYYATPTVQRNLVKKYGKFKINFTHANNLQRRLPLS